MTDISESLEARLRQAGVRITVPDGMDIGAASPWYVRLLAAASGWLASLFLMAFFGLLLTQVVESPPASLVTGLLLVVGAGWVMRADQNVFLEHGALAVSLAGQGFVAWALFRWLGGGAPLGLIAIAVFQWALALWMPAIAHRFVTALLGSLALAASLAMLGEWYLAIPVLLIMAMIAWWHEFRRPGQVRARQAIGYGVVSALIITSCLVTRSSPLHGTDVLRSMDGPLVMPWLAGLLSGCLFLIGSGMMARSLSQRLPRNVLVLMGFCGLLILALSMVMPGLVVGLAVLLLGFTGRQLVLMGLGVLALLGHVSAYYYHLDITLIAKAGYLMATGLGLLVIRWALLRFAVISREDSND